MDEQTLLDVETAFGQESGSLEWVATDGSDRQCTETETPKELAALLVINPEMLGYLLQLPEGCHIDRVAALYDRPGVLHLRVRGAGWPTKPGWLLKQTNGTITRYQAADGSVLRHDIDWGFPNVELTGDTKAQLLGRPAEPKA